MIGRLLDRCEGLPLPLRLLGGAVPVLLVFGLRLWLGGQEPGAAYAPFLPAIGVASAMFGWAGGLLAAVLSWLLAIHQFVDPVDSLRVQSVEDVVFAFLFATVAAFSVIVVRARRATAER